MTVVPDAAGRRVGGTGDGPPDHGNRSRPQPAPEPAAKDKGKAKGRRKSDPKPDAPKGKGKAGDAAAADQDGEKKGSKKKLIMIVGGVLVLVLGLYVVKGRSHHVVYKAGEPVPAGKVVSIGTITANTADGHLVQAGIDLQLTIVADTKQESTDAPQFTNAAIGDLSNWTYAQLLTSSGRTGLQKQMLTSFQKILGTTDGVAEQISAVYFTSFILQ